MNGNEIFYFSLGWDIGLLVFLLLFSVVMMIALSAENNRLKKFLLETEQSKIYLLWKKEQRIKRIRNE